MEYRMKHTYTKPVTGSRDANEMIDALTDKYLSHDPKRYDANEQELMGDRLTNGDLKGC